MRRGGPKRCVESQIAYFIAFGQSRLNIAAALAVSFSPRPSTGLLACESVKLGIKAAGGKFLGAADFLATLPPVGIMWGFGYRLRAGFLLRNLGAISDFFFLA